MIPHYLKLAAQVAILPPQFKDNRTYRLGSLGIRKDGVIVSARNGALFGQPPEHYKKVPQLHAEIRCLRKMDCGGIVYVSRIKADGTLALARPCPICQAFLKAKRIKKVIYSISDIEYGTLILE